jgi:Methyltransferase domain
MRDQTIVDQAQRPSGFLGRMMGEVMAATNRPRNTWLLGQLDIQPRQRGFEFGFGNGETLTGFLDRSEGGSALGVDWSQAMIDTASTRSKAAIKNHRLKLVCGDMADPAFKIDGLFDRIWCSNVIQMIADRSGLFVRLRANLAGEGLLALCFQPRGPSAPPPRILAPKCVDELKDAGFSQVETNWMPKASPEAFCIVARP